MSYEEDNVEKSTLANSKNMEMSRSDEKLISMERRSEHLIKVIFYWKKILLGILFVGVLCICGFFSCLTVYVIQSAKYKRIKKGLETVNLNGLPSSPLYAYSEPILVKGRTMTPNGVNFRVSVVLGYNEGDLTIFNLLETQKLMIQDQIRMNIAMRTDWPLEFSQEPYFKSELKEWLNTLLSGEYIQEIFFTDMQ